MQLLQHSLKNSESHQGKVNAFKAPARRCSRADGAKRLVAPHCMRNLARDFAFVGAMRKPAWIKDFCNARLRRGACDISRAGEFFVRRDAREASRRRQSTHRNFFSQDRAKDVREDRFRVEFTRIAPPVIRACGAKGCPARRRAWPSRRAGGEILTARNPQ
jgi:hypothetical protein